MTNKIFAAAIAAVLASAGMISFGNTTVNSFSAEVEETSALAGSAAGAATTEVDERIRPCDIISIDYCVDLYRPNGKIETTESYEALWIISIDEENQRYRVYTPRHCTKKKGILLYISFEDTKDAIVESHNGYVIGDMHDDGIVDVFDLAVMKRKLIEDTTWNNVEYTLADMNADGEVSVLDLVYLQKWVLGIK